MPKDSLHLFDSLNRKPVVSYVEPSAIESLSRTAIRDLNCHLMTRSARASTLGGIVRPICLAAFRLMTKANFVGCFTGKSVGFGALDNFI